MESKKKLGRNKIRTYCGFRQRAGNIQYLFYIEFSSFNNTSISSRHTYEATLLS